MQTATRVGVLRQEHQSAPARLPHASWPNCAEQCRYVAAAPRLRPNAANPPALSPPSAEESLAPVHVPVCDMAMRSNFAAMMKSFSCRPLIFLVCSETVA